MALFVTKGTSPKEVPQGGLDEEENITVSDSTAHMLEHYDAV